MTLWLKFSVWTQIIAHFIFLNTCLSQNTISRSDLYTMLRKSLGRSKVGAYSGRGAAEHTEFPHSLMTKSQNMYRVHPYSTPRNLLLPGLTFMGCKGKIYPRLWGQMPSLNPLKKLGNTPAPQKMLCKWSGFKGIFPAYFAVFGLTLENKNKRWGRGWHREGLTPGTFYFTEHVHST